MRSRSAPFEQKGTTEDARDDGARDDRATASSGRKDEEKQLDELMFVGSPELAKSGAANAPELLARASTSVWFWSSWVASCFIWILHKAK